MQRRPNVNYRDPDASDAPRSGIPEWLPSLIVFLFGMMCFGVIEILIHS